MCNFVMGCGEAYLRWSSRFWPAVIGVFLLGYALATPALAQDRTVVSGDRIRISVLKPRPRRVIGEFRAVTFDSLHFCQSDSDRSLNLQIIKKLEVSKGKKERLTGTLVGMIAGGFFGGFVGSSIEKGASDGCFDFCGFGGFVIGAAVGILGGGIAGYSLLAGDRWVQVPLPSQPRKLSATILNFQIAL